MKHKDILNLAYQVTDSGWMLAHMKTPNGVSHVSAVAPLSMIATEHHRLLFSAPHLYQGLSGIRKAVERIRQSAELHSNEELAFAMSTITDVIDTTQGLAIMSAQDVLAEIKKKG